MDELLNYLIGQKEEREKKLNEYDAAKAEYEAAKAKLEGFGNIESVKEEVEKLNGFIAKRSEEIEPKDEEEPVFGGAIMTEDGSIVGGVVDEVAVTEEA